MMPTLLEWLTYHSLKSVGFYGAWALFLAIPATFVMWGCIFFLDRYGRLKMTKGKWFAAWGITAMAFAGIGLLYAMGLPTAAGNVAAGRYEDGRAAYQKGDYATALQIFRPLAEQGSAPAQTALGIMHLAGQGVPQDYATAFAWSQKAAEQGDAMAQLNLGTLYFVGQGVPQDYAQALVWLGKAAEQGNAMAQGKIGMLYYVGEVVPQDYARAFAWSQKAAEQGGGPAQLSLGVMYFAGQGVPQDYVQAYMWTILGLSALGGGELDVAKARDNAVKFRDDVASNMTPAQIAEAQRLAREWKPVGQAGSPL